MTYEKEILEKIALQCNSYSEVVRKLGLKAYYGNRQTVKKYLDLFHIDVSHFGNYRCGGDRKQLPLDKILIEGCSYDNRQLKKRLVDEKLLEYKCDSCFNEGEWMGKPITLQLDHKNGINNDNRLGNLRFLCPNCHSQTETFSGKNIKLKPEKQIEYCECGNIKAKTSKFCKNCSKTKQRKTDRPTYLQLIIEIKELGYVDCGKKYNVSDNTIRKWKKFYEKMAV